MQNAKWSTAMRPAPACQDIPAGHPSAAQSVSSTLNAQHILPASNKSVKILASVLVESGPTAKWSITMLSALVLPASEEILLHSVQKFLQVSFIVRFDVLGSLGEVVMSPVSPIFHIVSTVNS